MPRYPKDTMSDMKQVKVDNWGIYFLQRLKHFFNRTDYCDLTLQFQDNAQLKVHRLVLNACTEYFELLERTCEMYEDCLIMPDDLQADVVVPIINFMYTGQLEFKPDLLERLYQTSQIMNMPVLSKLLLAQKQQTKTSHSSQRPTILNNQPKRSFQKAFSVPDHGNGSSYREKQPQRKIYNPTKKIAITHQEVISQKKKPAPLARTPSVRTPVSKTQVVKAIRPPAVHPASVSIYDRPVIPEKKKQTIKEVDPRPTRYEVPDDLADNIYDESFSHISYESKPLMVHPETSKRYGAKKPRFGIFNDASITKYNNDSATIDVVECRKISQKENIFEHDSLVDPLMFDSIIEQPVKKDSSQLFDQILETSEPNGPKITIENKDKDSANNIDHAKIISEVLKKYPHLVKGNKNIKLKILDTKPKVEKKHIPKKNVSVPNYSDVKVKTEKMEEDYTYETEVIDSKEAARLISLGAENVKGPWICLICGTPGRALHFATYHQFRRHLVDVHNEKIVPNICEYCGIKSNKRNHLLHHLLTKHGVTPPAHVKFPKCNVCNYVALTDAFLAKHKSSHTQEKLLRCNVCFDGFQNSTQLLEHIQETGHKIKYNSDKRTMLRCVYCLKEFIKENNLYAHLVSRHKDMATKDGIIDGSDASDEETSLKGEPAIEYESAEDETKELKYEIPLKSNEKAHITNISNTSQKQRILNVGYDDVSIKNPVKNTKTSTINNTFSDTDFMGEEIEVILPDNVTNEEVLMSNVEFERQSQSTENEEFLVEIQPQQIQLTPSTSKTQTNIQMPRVVKKSGEMGQELQIVVSSAEELKTFMGSNHPIIFDQEGNPSKTLAVLTTPQCTTMGTGTQINIGTNNPNEVMILPDQYVPEEMSSNNSNIVVVYSDDLDQTIINPNYAQGQFVTTEDFVQTSAVITPNYSTVPTSVINQDMTDTQAETWQGIERSIDQEIPMDTEEHVTANDQLLIGSEIQSNNLDEVADISVMEEQQENITMDQSEQLNKENNTAEIIDARQLSDDAIAITTETINVKEQNEEVDVNETEPYSNKNIELSIGSDEGVIETPNPEPVQESESAIEDAQQDSQEITNNVTLSDNHDTNETVDENTSIENNEQDNAVEVPQEAVKQIANLTSEWSEDEDDKQDHPKETEILQETEVAQFAPTEMEESIENIQQEVNKQIEPDVIDKNEGDIVKDEDDQTEKTQEHKEPAEEVSQTDDSIEKTVENVAITEAQQISSLLHDWNENDSQEEKADSQEDVENEGKNGGHVESTDEASESVAAPAEESPKPKKADNIRSLVSDWDEEDEESKA